MMKKNSTFPDFGFNPAGKLKLKMDSHIMSRWPSLSHSFSSSVLPHDHYHSLRPTRAHPTSWSLCQPQASTCEPMFSARQWQRSTWRSTVQKLAKELCSDRWNDLDCRLRVYQQKFLLLHLLYHRLFMLIPALLIFNTLLSFKMLFLLRTWTKWKNI